jgi:hypothetical protein
MIILLINQIVNIDHVIFVQIVLIHKGDIFLNVRKKEKKLIYFHVKTKSLEILGRWILNVVTTKNENEKRKLLNKLFPTLSTFNSNNQSTSIQLELEVNLSSLFLIKQYYVLKKLILQK